MRVPAFAFFENLAEVPGTYPNRLVSFLIHVLGALLCAKIAIVKREEMCGSWWDAGGVWKKHAVDRSVCTLCFFAVFLAHFGLSIVSNFDPNPWT